MQEPLVLVTIYNHLFCIFDKMSFLRAFPQLRQKGYIKKIKEIKHLPRKAFGKGLIRMIKGHGKQHIKRYLWARSSINIFRPIAPFSTTYIMDDIRKRANVYTTKKGDLVIQNPDSLFS